MLLAIASFPAGAVSERFAHASAKASAEQKVLYVLITTPGCGWCDRFKRQTLSDAGVRARLAETAVVFETERGSGEYPDALKACRVPMHYFLGSDDAVLVKMPGYWNVEDFMSILDDVERKRK